MMRNGDLPAAPLRPQHADLAREEAQRMFSEYDVSAEPLYEARCTYYKQVEHVGPASMFIVVNRCQRRSVAFSYLSPTSESHSQ